MGGKRGVSVVQPP